MASVRHKCFITYHHADQTEVSRFISTFDQHGDVLIARGLGQGMAEDVIGSNDTSYVMQRIRQLYLQDSTVTIVLMGQCTWARRYVDWEIQSSLRRGETVTPNGLLGIKLPSHPSIDGQFPNRLNLNLRQADNQADCYARWVEYPESLESLASSIHAAFERRTTHADWIQNPRDRFMNNRTCP